MSAFAIFPKRSIASMPRPALDTNTASPQSPPLLARVQLRHLDERNKCRDDNVMYLMDGIAECPGIYPIKPSTDDFRGLLQPSLCPLCP